ncbi:MAG: alpha/beta hydrolase family esterase [Polyangiales bacterium]
MNARLISCCVLGLLVCSCSSSAGVSKSHGSDASTPRGADGGTSRGDAATANDAATDGDAAADGTATGDVMRTLTAYPDRPYIVHAPPMASAAPVVIVLHGGGGNAKGTARLTCPRGLLSSPRCLNALADREGFVVVYPNGTGTSAAPETRTWNAGGGTGDWQCVSGPACKNDVDDVAYIRALIDDLAASTSIDEKRIFATGISDGAAMAHRLGCEASDRIAAIAPVAGGNQFSTGAACTTTRPVSDLEIHGTSDPCWAFEGGTSACLQMDDKNKISVADTVSGWVERDGCPTTGTTSMLADTDANDGTTTTATQYSPCKGGTEVALLEITGGGHTWPGGFQYLPKADVGAVSLDFDANERIWAFFKRHPMP